MKSLDLTGRVSVITGATQGIGKSIAETLSWNGSDIAIIDINEKDGLEVRNLIRGKAKVRCEFYRCDVSKNEEVSIVCKNILSDFKKVDNLVLNAGFSIREDIMNINIESWNKIIEVNLNGSFYFILNLIKPMISQKKGSIVFIASSSATTGSGGGISYPASKAGVIGIAKAICYHCLQYGVRANVISPGAIATPLLRKKYPDTEEGNKKLADQVPLGRYGVPEDIANTALFLVSDMSDFICGQEILVDGGRTLYTHPAGS